MVIVNWLCCVVLLYITRYMVIVHCGCVVLLYITHYMVIVNWLCCVALCCVALYYPLYAHC